MRCPSCEFENPEGKKFCEECGTKLVQVCPSCGAEVRPTAKFCGDCGATLGAAEKSPPAKSRKPQGPTGARKARRPVPSPSTAKSRPAVPEAERRQLTVMFCDLVGSTALSAQLDPEELREVVRAYQETCATVIQRYEGHIAQYLGDGLLVYFGYPSAHEDDAARAVRAGLRIVEALRGLNTRLSHPLQVRIGIHTGPVVVGSVGGGIHQEQLALGETPNLAARIQGIAAPDEVVISAATYRLVEGLFECEDRGRSELKGASTPLMLYRVSKEGEAQSRFQVVVRKGLTRLVGRDHEHGLLQERWERVKDGAGQVVLLSGEPGIGKSRLVEVLKETVERESSPYLELRCSPYAQSSALQPVIEHLQRQLQLRPNDPPETNLEKLRQALRRSRFCQADTLPLLAALLSLPHPPEVPPLTLSPQKQKEKTYETVVAWLCEEARQRAVTYAWEDLHWADPSTLELLAVFLEQVPTTRLLAVLTFRPEFIPPWGAHSYLSQLTLSRLGRHHVEMMVANVAGGKALPAEVMQQIVNKTDGVPLFVEELTKMVVESDLVTEANGHYELRGPLPPLAIPSTLQDSLMARLDRLATVREIAQIGATIGREFDYAVLRAVSPLNEDILQQGLRQLVAAELLFQSGVPPQARYLFKHALVQDAAYQSLLKSRRQQLHQQVAQVLEQRFPDTLETQPELVSHHYTEANLIEQALPYWQRAGQRAFERSAHAEAVTHLTKGLAGLKTLADTPERAAQELTLQTTLGHVFVAIKGYGAPEVGRTYTRARELCQQIGEPPQLFPVLRGLWTFYVTQPDLQTAREMGEQCLRFAHRQHDSALFVEACYALGNTLFFLGELGLAREHLEQGIAAYDPDKHRANILLYGQDPGVFLRVHSAMTSWVLGYPDQALKRVQEALALLRDAPHPFSLGFALSCSGWVHQYRREAQAAREQAEAAIELSTDQGFPFWLSMGTVFRGWALTEHAELPGRRARGEEGIAQIRQGLEAWRAIGVGLMRPHQLGLLAEAYGKLGRTEEGLLVLTEALDIVQRNEERYYEAELYRLKGELTLQKAGTRGWGLGTSSTSPQVPSLQPQDLKEVEQEAEECFHKAIEIARRQQAKSWELRAVMSLSRLWQQQGKTTEAHQMLSKIFGWFTEGFDTKDLQEAKALLEELS